MSAPDNTEETPPTEQIEAEISETRDHLADAVDQLAAKLDVKTQAQEKIQHTKEQAQAKVQEQGAKVQAAAENVQHKAAQTADQVTTASKSLVDRFLGAGRGIQAAVVGVPVAVLILLIVRRARR